MSTLIKINHSHSHSQMIVRVRQSCMLFFQECVLHCQTRVYKTMTTHELKMNHMYKSANLRPKARAAAGG